MQETTVHIAKPIAGDEPIATKINISEPLPDSDDWVLADAKELYRSDAQKIMDALKNLPQGTKHQLLLLMLEAQKVYFVGR